MGKSNIFIDPDIDMNSKEMITVIIQFKTKPAQVAVTIAEKSGVPLSLENANWAVEHSHARFQEDVKRFLVSKRIPYSINHIYKSALNGVSMSIPAYEIKTLLKFNEIESIHANKEYHLDPPSQNNLM
jgi:hypothetical protein